MKVRSPCQAGRFYAATRPALMRQIENCFSHELGPGKVPAVNENGPRKLIGLVSPHAGYIYSGPIAAHSYYALAEDGRPDVIVILGPNHTGHGSGLSIMREGIWRTPLGDVEIDSETADSLGKSSIVDFDDLAHSYEHSIEVQLPFLQYLFGSSFKFVPMCFLMQDLTTSREVGSTIAATLNKKNALIIASTDMTHYEQHDAAKEKDRKALKAIERLDEEEFYLTVERNHITACGYGPVTTLMVAARHLGGSKAETLCYKTSGDVAGDFSSVVGYASVAFTK